MGPSWAISEPSWAVLRPSWTVLGSSGRPLGAILGALGALFGLSWIAFRRPVAPPKPPWIYIQRKSGEPTNINKASNKRHTERYPEKFNGFWPSRLGVYIFCLLRCRPPTRPRTGLTRKPCFSQFALHPRVRRETSASGPGTIQIRDVILALATCHRPLQARHRQAR